MLDGAQNEKRAEANRFNWRFLAYGVILAVPYSALLALCHPDTGFLIFILTTLLLSILGCFFLVLGLTNLILTLLRRRGRGWPPQLPAMLAIVIFWFCSGFFVVADNHFGPSVRTTTRWLIWSRKYKAEVLAQPAPANGELRHIEWESSGWAGMDTTVFLIYDPTDSLLVAAKTSEAGEFNGIPCEVAQVRQLESHWYIAIFGFYVDEDWRGCH